MTPEDPVTHMPDADRKRPHLGEGRLLSVLWAHLRCWWFLMVRTHRLFTNKPLCKIVIDHWLRPTFIFVATPNYENRGPLHLKDGVASFTVNGNWDLVECFYINRRRVPKNIQENPCQTTSSTPSK